MSGYVSRWPLLTALLVSAALAGCGGPLRFTPQGTAKAPGADGLIVADVNSDASMTRLNVKVENLPPPDRLEGGGTTFVAWAKSDKDEAWQRIGALEYDADARKAALPEASFPHTEFELKITVESKSDPESPSSVVVISQTVDD